MLIQLLFALLVIGVVCWFVGQVKQLDDTVKKLIQAVLILVALFLTLQAFGVMGGPRTGRLLW